MLKWQFNSQEYIDRMKMPKSNIKITQTAYISSISLIKSLASSAGSSQTAGVGCIAAKMSNCR